MIKIAIDAMGGDYAPKEIVEGVNLAINKHQDLNVILFGDEEQIKKYLTVQERVEIVHTPYKLDMGEKNPVLAIRQNKELSLVKAFQSVHDKECQGVVTCGPTQCVVCGAHMIVKKLPGMQRVALCPALPKVNGKSRMILDVGANTELKPEHIEQLALFVSTFIKEFRGIEKPLIGLINIGSEPGKGREQDKETFKLLQENEHINFYGNVEPTEIFTSDCDAYVTDGFSGNLILKTTEGVAKTMGNVLKENIMSSLAGKIGAIFMKKNLKNFKKTMSGDEVGGALLFGVDGVVVKAHGNSKAPSVATAIETCMKGVQSGYIDIMREHLNQESIQENKNE